MNPSDLAILENWFANRLHGAAGERNDTEKQREEKVLQNVSFICKIHF